MGRRVCLGSSELAILYSDQSVLEMHHLASAFQLMQRPECGMLASLRPSLEHAPAQAVIRNC